MKTVRIVACVLPLTLLVMGCERHQGSSVTDPAPTAAVPEVLEAHWVWDKGLNDAIQSASVSPLVRKAVAESPYPGAKPLWSKAVRAEGRLAGDRTIGVTILPYSVESDPTHAFFVSLYERDGEQIAEPAELIVGRRPSVTETGFVPVWQGDRYVYVKTENPYAIGASGPYRLSAERIKWAKFFQCFAQRAPGYCATGSAIGSEIAPNYPYASAIGCGVGMALAGLECLFGSK